MAGGLPTVQAKRFDRDVMHDYGDEEMQIISEVPITPKLLAEAFWNLSSIEQAEFFSELHDILDGKEWPAHSLGEMQWMYMSDEIEKNPKAKKMACALAANIFVRASDYMNRHIDYA